MFPPWKQHEGNQKKIFKKGGFQNQQKTERKQDRFSLVTKTPREIFALDKGKFKASPPMTTPVEKQNHAKFYEFHGKVGHNTDEYEGAKGPMIIEAEIGGHRVHRMYVDGESTSENMYEHCFGRPRPEIKKQLIPATTPLIGFSGKIIWPMGNPSAVKPIIEERVKVAINPEYPKLTIMIGSALTEKGRNKLCGLLQRNLDIFAWKPADMTGVPKHISEHRLNVRKGCSPVRQKKRGQATDRNQAIQEEVGKLMEARIMRETTKAEEAFKQMKQLIVELPKLMAPMEKEELIVYLAATKETVSAVLIMKREDKQMPIYFVSRELRGPKLNYTSMEKLVLALVHASKCLKRYFQAHPIIVITDQPIQQILSRPKVAGRLQKWSIELGEYAIHYRPRVSVKGQILADFIIERPEEDSPDTPMEEEEKLSKSWILFTDGSYCTDAKYEALIAGLRIAKQMAIKNLQANVDSCLVANQVNGTYVDKEADMIRYLEKVKELTGSFKAFSIKQIPMSKNKKANALSKIASISFAHLSKQVLVEELKEKSISEVEILVVVEEEGDTWMTPIFKYLAEGTLPADVKKEQ
nr:reverse transcriptase domain-containing protein [Tanacetum cinerariifolium]